VSDFEWLPLPDAATALGIDILKIRQYVRDGQLLAIRGEDGVARVPADFIADGRVVKHLPGVITLLRDNRFTDDEAVQWLFTPDDTLPGPPIQALRENRGTEVKRRAQALGW